MYIDLSLPSSSIHTLQISRSELSLQKSENITAFEKENISFLEKE